MSEKKLRIEDVRILRALDDSLSRSEKERQDLIPAIPSLNSPDFLSGLRRPQRLLTNLKAHATILSERLTKWDGIEVWSRGENTFPKLCVISNLEKQEQQKTWEDLFR